MSFCLALLLPPLSNRDHDFVPSGRRDSLLRQYLDFPSDTSSVVLSEANYGVPDSIILARRGDPVYSV